MKQVTQLKKQSILLMVVIALLWTACDDPSEATEAQQQPDEEATTVPQANAARPGRGMGPGSGMMARHQATVPEAYAGLTNPLEATDEVLAAGEEIYSTNCATCHGDGGMGDGPAGTGLEPPAAPVAHTSQMLGDDYLFWRVSEGGAMAPFNSAMPAWKGTLTEEERWQAITYVRALGAGTVTPGRMMGGAMYDPEEEAAERAEMLAEAVESGLIDEAEASLFADVHGALDELMAGRMPRATGGMATMQLALLTDLVNEGTITEEQAKTFERVHERLLEAGVMQ